MNAPLPPDEADRLEELHRYRILDTLPERDYDDLTLLASRLLDAPISLISLVDAQRQWFKSTQGTDVQESPRSESFCAWAILDPAAIMEVPDASQDERFADNGFVVNPPHVRFYAGAPLVNRAGRPLGTLCVLDVKPRHLDDAQRETLRVLARQVASQLELRRLVSELEYERGKLRESNDDLERVKRQLSRLIERVGETR